MPLKTMLATAGVLAMTLSPALDSSSPAAASEAEHVHEDPTVLTLTVNTDPTAEEEAAAEEEPDFSITQKGTTYTPDYDGVVPTYYGGDCNDNVLAYATWWSEGDWYIVYDKCYMDKLGAGQNDWDRVGAHEYAHTEGWGHYEEPAALNAAYEPTITICQC